NGGEIIARDPMGMKKLAYPIEKNARGYFYVIYYKIAPSAISEIERRFRINEEILRFVTMKYDTKREIKAWNDMVEKTKKVAPAAVVAEKTEEVAS
ncbi:MAG: 30S ribosomal protein S6, partial [Sulfuricurvum sp. 24-42-5]